VLPRCLAAGIERCCCGSTTTHAAGAVRRAPGDPFRKTLSFLTGAGRPDMWAWSQLKDESHGYALLLPDSPQRRDTR
jgi:hypothetical protein